MPRFEEKTTYGGNRQGLAATVPLLALIAACNAEPPEPDPLAGAGQACDRDAFLEAELYGGIRTSLNWRAADMDCEGMPRPAGDGARLRLAGPLPAANDAGSLAFIIALPGLEKGGTGSELPTNITLIEEKSGRFFATRDASGCWTDVSQHRPIANMDADAANHSEFSISGVVYCIVPLAELNGGSSITFTDLKFTGRLNWDAPR